MPKKFRSLSPIDPQGNATMDRSISHSWQFRGCAIKAGKKNLLSNSPVFLGSWYQLLKVNKLKVFNPNQSSLLSMKFLCHSWPKRHNLIGVWLSQYDVIRFIRMTSLCSTAAPDCRTSQSKGRYCAHACSILVIIIVLGHLGRALGCLSLNWHGSVVGLIKNLLSNSTVFLDSWLLYQLLKVTKLKVFNPNQSSIFLSMKFLCHFWSFGQSPGLPILKLTWQHRGAELEF